MTLLEVCVDDADGLATAIAGGADRIELCSSLELGGLTPSAGLMRQAAKAPIPTRAMIRPRAGDFIFTAADIDTMLGDIAAARAAGLAGVVLGASLADGRLDGTTLRQLVAAADGLALTLHRAFDLVPDLAEAVELAVALGFDTILTSGRATSALAGVADIAQAHALAAGRIGIMAGAGIDDVSARQILAITPLSAVHGSCSAPARADNAIAEALGFASPARKATHIDRVNALRRAIA